MVGILVDTIVTFPVSLAVFFAAIIRRACAVYTVVLAGSLLLANSLFLSLVFWSASTEEASAACSVDAEETPVVSSEDTAAI